MGPRPGMGFYSVASLSLFPAWWPQQSLESLNLQPPRTLTPSVTLQRNAFANDTIPAESYISAVQAAHLGALCSQSLPLAASLKHTLLSLVRFTGDLVV